MKKTPARWKKAAGAIIGGGAFFCAAFFLFLTPSCVNQIAFQPPDHRSRLAPSQLESIPLPNGETLSVRWIPPPDDAAPVVLFSHGNAEDLSNDKAPVKLFSHGNDEDLYDIQSKLYTLSMLGWGAASYDYEGYGKSTGKPSEEAAYRDIDAVYQWLVDVKKISPDRILNIGFSIGSGPACYLAEHKPVRALILLAPFASAFRAVVTADWLPGDFFPNAERVKNIHCPVLIIHGTHDSVIPQRNGLTVFQAANEPKKFISVPSANHNNLFVYYNMFAFKREVETLIEKKP